MRLIDNIKIGQAITPTAGLAGTSDINGAILDMQNFDEALAIVTAGVLTSTAVTTALLQEGDVANMSDAAAITGATVSIADDDDDQVFVVAVHRIRKRYLRLVVERATANAVISAANYVQSSARKGPATAGTNTTVVKVTPES